MLNNDQFKIYELAEQAYLKYFPTLGLDIKTTEEAIEYTKDWPFKFSDVFYFSKNGLVFVY